MGLNDHLRAQLAIARHFLRDANDLRYRSIIHEICLLANQNTSMAQLHLAAVNAARLELAVECRTDPPPPSIVLRRAYHGLAISAHLLPLGIVGAHRARNFLVWGAISTRIFDSHFLRKIPARARARLAVRLATVPTVVHEIFELPQHEPCHIDQHAEAVRDLAGTRSPFVFAGILS